jgi:sialate O-acetylesterase
LVARCGEAAARCIDILVGEVWVCSGQSNMAWKLHQCGEVKPGSADFELPRIRLLTVDTKAKLGKQDAVDGRWQAASLQTLAQFSAVGGFFGRRLHEELAVPIGLICNAWGGTRVQAWMSREALMQDPLGRDEIAYSDSLVHNPAGEGCLDKEEWERRCGPGDAGNRGVEQGWADPGHDCSAWPTMPIPCQWQTKGHRYSGVFWFRRTVQVPAAWAGQDLELFLGAVDKHDVSYVNGEQVGATGWEAGPDSWCTARRYPVAGRLVPADGRLCLAVRAHSHAFDGGMIGPATVMRVQLPGQPATGIPLAGDWHYQVEQNFGLISVPPLPWGSDNPNCPAILFDNRLWPILGYGIRGAIWYQGESNAEQAAVYRRMFPAMIRDWRRAWAQGDFPFLFVQLANYGRAEAEPMESNWAQLREAQTATLAEPQTEMAVIIESGEADNIHPKDKRTVGDRLARLALSQTYGRSLCPHGPLFRAAQVESGGRIRCRFDRAEGLRTRDGKAPARVEISGFERRFRWAEARIEGETLVVWHPDIAQPMAVRYAWGNNPESCNLVNGDDLPASPFRSDDW